MKKIVELLRLSNKKYNQTIVIITHDLEIAKLADRVIKLKTENSLIGKRW